MLKKFAPAILGISAGLSLVAGSAATVMASSAPAVVAASAAHARPAHIYDG